MFDSCFEVIFCSKWYRFSLKVVNFAVYVNWISCGFYKAIFRVEVTKKKSVKCWIDDTNDVLNAQWVVANSRFLFLCFPFVNAEMCILGRLGHLDWL